MKSIIALTCVLTAAACAAPGVKPTPYPESGYNSPTPSDNAGTPVASRTHRAAPMPNASEPTNPARRKSVDNTKVNERDRGSDTLTPMDQGNSGAETKISADIRRGIMSDDNLSFTAKNVKIITVGTKVTLRGPVNSGQERSTIEALAKRTAGVSEIDNQLEIKK